MKDYNSLFIWNSIKSFKKKNTLFNFCKRTDHSLEIDWIKLRFSQTIKLNCRKRNFQHVQRTKKSFQPDLVCLDLA